MNGFAKTENTTNPWKNRDNLGRPSNVNFVLSGLIYAVCALALPLFFSSAVPERVSLASSAILLVVLAFYLGYTVRLVRPLLFAATIVFFTLMLFRNVAHAAIILSWIVGTMSGAALFTAFRSPWLSLLLPAVSGAGVYLATGEIASAALALVILPPACLLGLATLLSRKRTEAILFAELGLLASLAVAVIVLLKRECGTLSMDAIAKYFDELREVIVSALKNARDEVFQIVGDQGGASAVEAGAVSISDELLETLVSQTFNVMPAMFVIVCAVVAFSAQDLLNAFYYSNGMRGVLTVASTVFSMSLPAAVIYVITFFMSMFGSADNLAIAVGENMCLMLMPGFCLLGWQAIVMRFRGMRGGGRIFFLTMLLAFFLCCSAGGLLVLGLFGAGAVIFGSIVKHTMMRMMNNAQSGNFGNGGNSPYEGDFEEHRGEDGFPEDESGRDPFGSRDRDNDERNDSDKDSDGDGRGQ